MLAKRKKRIFLPGRNRDQTLTLEKRQFRGKTIEPA
jgi:hypothetical protein